jgi:hypothetical protein
LDKPRRQKEQHFQLKTSASAKSVQKKKYFNNSNSKVIKESKKQNKCHFAKNHQSDHTNNKKK